MRLEAWSIRPSLIIHRFLIIRYPAGIEASFERTSSGSPIKQTAHKITHIQSKLTLSAKNGLEFRRNRGTIIATVF
jgi:hypothetical protein